MALDILKGPNSLPVASIRTDGGTQARLRINDETVTEYAEALVGGAIFPPVMVYYDGGHYWLAGGFHPLAAYKQSEYAKSIMADIRQGTRRDAVLCAVGSNASHGLRRTNEDKRNAVLTLLRDEEWGKWSDREIARAAQVSHPTVARIRAETSSLEKLPVSGERTYTTKHGTVATMQTANIGQPAQPSPALIPDQTDKFTFQARVAAVNLVLQEQPEAREAILDDLRNGRKGWYHELILCYTDDTDDDTWRRVAREFGDPPPNPEAPRVAEVVAQVVGQMQAGGAGPVDVSDEGREWVRLQGMDGAIVKARIGLEEKLDVFESYGFGQAVERVLRALYDLREEVRRLKPGDKIGGHR